MGLFDRLKAVFSPGDQGAHYRCRRCERAFAYRADLTNPTCPYCDSDALEPTDPP